ncbi:STAS/SEC14 domain-containing protein [Fulvivirga ulvae]|uniref:DUF7793 family protein n=1 Tax=Fulvivirga ulvae TaxID=2904245 RepID=UPI001F409C59|nr:STAS/SEC14 domain-containing protein [Fulvivirga ulvae]UII31279.1 STAS/SEC14 domain-containing protein [Fulvivirga ulvae]
MMQRETDKIKYVLNTDGILCIECSPNTIMTLEDGKTSTRIGTELISGNPVPMLCDLTNVVKMTQDCRKHFSGAEHARIFTKCALIITSPISRIIGNFFLGANKPLKPTRLFTNKVEAIKWLKNE